MKSVAVGDDVLFDSYVNIARHHPVLQQFVLTPIGSETHDTGGPGLRHAWDLQQLLCACMVDVYPHFRRWRLMSRSALRINGQRETQRRHHQRRDPSALSHSVILRLIHRNRKQPRA
jgi:hypothetical protein